MGISLIEIFEYIGVAAFAISGAYVAIQKRMDIFGVYVIAFITSCGGGIIRDVVMDEGVPLFFNSYTIMIIVIISTTIAIAFKSESKTMHMFMITCDALGLGIFAVNAGVKAINAGYNFPQFLFVASITAVGGGVMRDLLCQRVPVILRKEIYAMWALIGSAVLWFIHPLIGITLSMYLSLTFIVVFRLISAYKNINLPVPRESK